MEDLLKHRENRKKDLSDMYALIYGAGNGIFDGATSTKSPNPISRLPFNLNKALEGYKVVDDLGREARVVAKLSCKHSYPVVVIRTNGSGEYIQHYSTEGICEILHTKLYMASKQEMKFSFVTPVKGVAFSSEEGAKEYLRYHQPAGRLKGAEIVAQVVTTLVKN